MSVEEDVGNLHTQIPDLSEQVFQESVESEQPLDDLAYINELGSRLRNLLDGYRDALLYIERWGFSIASVDTCDISVPDERRRDVNWILEKAQTMSKGRTSTKLVAKRITLWFVEAHIRARLVQIARQTRILGLTIPNRTEEDGYRILNQYSEQLEQYSQILFQWGRLKDLFLGPSLINLVIALLSPLILGGVIINLSSPADFAAVPTWGKFVIGIILLIFVFFVVPVGFRTKRAVFTGGITDYDVTQRSLKGETLSTFWFDNENIKFSLPRGKNIYTLEKEVFECLDVRKPIEFPADVWFNRWFSFIWGVAGLAFFGAIYTYINLPNYYVVYFVTAGSLLVAIVTTYFVYINYRKRVRFGDV